eukprot:3820038-Amphidinium_carterae.1
MLVQNVSCHSLDVSQVSAKHTHLKRFRNGSRILSSIASQAKLLRNDRRQRYLCAAAGSGL